MKKIFKTSELENNLQKIIIIIFIMILGLLSRSINIIPYFVGDVLRGMMIFFIVNLCIRKNAVYIVVTSLVICFGIEYSQLLDYNWLIAIRNTLIGGLILGKGFLFTDLLSYTIGIAFSYFVISGLISPSQ